MSNALPPPLRAATLRSRPFLFISTFLVFHQAVATGALFPTYAFFSGTNTSTALLAGPTAAAVLRQPLPWPRASGGDNRTVADFVEDALRGSVRTGVGALRAWRERRAAGAGDAGPAVAQAEEPKSQGIFRAALARATGRGGARVDAAAANVEDTETADAAIGALEGRRGAAWKAKLLDRAGAVRMQDALDVAAAYLVVKVRACAGARGMG
jgi:hypothetical protein